jgi:hypothetical protein
VWHRVFPASWDACSQREATVNIYGLQKVHDRTKCLEEESSLLGDNPSLPDCLPASPYFGPIPSFAGCRAGSPCSRDAAHTKRGPCRGPGWASCQGPSATISPNSQRRLSRSHLVGSEFQGLVLCLSNSQSHQELVIGKFDDPGACSALRRARASTASKASFLGPPSDSTPPAFLLGFWADGSVSGVSGAGVSTQISPHPSPDQCRPRPARGPRPHPGA